MVDSVLTVGLTSMGHQTSSFVERFRQVMLKPFLEEIALKGMPELRNTQAPVLHPPLSPIVGTLLGPGQQAPGGVG